MNFLACSLLFAYLIQVWLKMAILKMKHSLVNYLEYHQYWQNLKVHKFHYVSQVYITFVKIVIAAAHIFIIIECNIFLYACCLEGLISDAGN